MGFRGPAPRNLLMGSQHDTVASRGRAQEPLSQAVGCYAISRIGKEVELGYLSKIVPRNRQSIDVGANLGVYARALSKLTPMVHAFEPSKELALILRCTLPRNVTVHETALSDRAGRALLRTPVVDGKRIFGLASLEQHASHPRLETEIVELSRLDDLIDGDVGFINDVEGHELRVLTGAKSVIKQCRPVLLIECEERHNPGGPAKLFDYLGQPRLPRPLCAGWRHL